MSAVALLRRPGSAPPLSPARQRLAEAIAAQTAAAERIALLVSAQTRARTAWTAADAALTAAREGAEEAALRAHEHNVATLLGNPPPSIPTRRDAAATLQGATDAATDAEAAAHAIAAELDTLQAGGRERADKIAAAASAVMREEMQPAAEALAAEIVALQRDMIDKGRALLALSRHNVVATQAPAATPAASAARAALESALIDCAAWHRAGSSPSEARYEAALAALKADAMAEVPR